MRAVIVDDEPDAIFTLELILKEYWPEIDVIGKYLDPYNALDAIQIIQPELVFLDINMPGMNGFEMLLKMQKIDFDLVFTTAYDEYAIKAFKFNAIDYLLKPIDIEELSSTIKRIKEKNRKKLAEPFDINKLIAQINVQHEEKISFSTNDGIYFIRPSEIIYLLASRSYTKIIRKDADIIFVSKTMKDLENILGSDFYRIHNSYIVNLKYVKMIDKTDGWNLLMENGDKIPIARRKKAEITEMISKIAKIQFG